MTLKANNRLRGSKSEREGTKGQKRKDKNARRGKTSTIAVKAFDSIEAAIGGRDAVVEALAVSDLTEEQQYLFGMIADPRNDTRSLASICAKANYTIGHLLQLFKDAKLARAQVEAISAVADTLPTVAADVMTLAKIAEDPCLPCKGTGQMTTPPDKHGEIQDVMCAACDGKGTQTYTPGIERQKLALELGGLYSRGTGGVQIANVFSPGPPPADLGGRITADYLKDMRMGTDRLLYPGRSAGVDTSEAVIVDAEIVKEEKEGPKEGQRPEVAEAPEAAESSRAESETKSESEEKTREEPPLLIRVEESRSSGGQVFLPPAGKRP